MFSTFQMISGNFSALTYEQFAHSTPPVCNVMSYSICKRITRELKKFSRKNYALQPQISCESISETWQPSIWLTKVCIFIPLILKTSKRHQAIPIKMVLLCSLSDTWCAWIWAHFFSVFFFMKILNYWKSEILFSVCQLPKVGETCSQSKEETVYSGQQTTARLTDQSQGRKWAPSWENMSSVCDQLRLKPACSADETS